MQSLQLALRSKKESLLAAEQRWYMLQQSSMAILDMKATLLSVFD